MAVTVLLPLLRQGLWKKNEIICIIFLSRVSNHVFWNYPGTLAFPCLRTVFHTHRTRHTFVQIVEEYLRKVKI